MRTYYIYILTNKKNGTLYVGMTNDLLRRVYEHRCKLNKGFTSDYDLYKLVYFEQTDCVEAAIRREKNLKAWKRAWKLKLIEEMNPNWLDLYYEYGGKEYEENFDLNELKEKYGKNKF
jgi:putative endonuclease